MFPKLFIELVFGFIADVDVVFMDELLLVASVGVKEKRRVERNKSLEIFELTVFLFFPY